MALCAFERPEPCFGAGQWIIQIEHGGEGSRRLSVDNYALVPLLASFPRIGAIKTQGTAGEKKQAQGY